MRKSTPTVKVGKYRHFKGMIVEVIAVGRHSETQEAYVIYREFGEFPDWGKDPVWVRPFKMFVETIQRDGKRMPRFTAL